MKTWITALTCLLMAGPLSAQSATLFVETNPLGALVVIDQLPQEKTAPLLLRNLAPKEYRVSVFKPGYLSRESLVTLLPDEVKTLRFNLDKSYTNIAITDEESLLLAGKTAQPHNLKYHLPDGDYRFHREDGTLKLDPVFPQEDTLAITTYALPATLIAAGALTIQNLNSPWNSQWKLAPLTMTAYALFASDLLWFIALNSQKAHFEEARKFQGQPQSAALDFDLDLYAKAEKALENGDLASAIQNYTTLVTEYPESLLTPPSLFKLARLHAMLGQTDLARIEYQMITDLYPLASLYDKACKALADMDFAAERYEQAQKQLELMTFKDPLITRDDIEELRTQIKNALAGAKK